MIYPYQCAHCAQVCDLYPAPEAPGPWLCTRCNTRTLELRPEIVELVDVLRSDRADNLLAVRCSADLGGLA